MPGAETIGKAQPRPLTRRSAGARRRGAGTAQVSPWLDMLVKGLGWALPLLQSGAAGAEPVAVGVLVAGEAAAGAAGLRMEPVAVGVELVFDEVVVPSGEGKVRGKV